MPKQNFITVQLAPKRYDRCADCPLCGLIPENERTNGDVYVCLGDMYAITTAELFGDVNKLSCDNRWDLWMLELPKRRFKISEHLYKKYRLPFEQSKKD